MDVLTLATGLLIGLARQAPIEGLNGTRVREDLHALASAVRDDWSYFEMRTESRDVDFDALFAAAHARLADGGTRAEIAQTLTELVAGLHDGHAVVFVPGVEKQAQRALPFELRECSDGVVISRVTAEAGVLTPGDVVLTLDGRDAREFVGRRQHEMFASTPRARRAQALDAAHWTDANEIELEIATGPVDSRKVRVATLASAPEALARAPQGAAPTLTWPREDVAQLTIPSFALADWKRWLAASKAEKDALLPEVQARFDALLDSVVERKPRALVIDLRGNTGGTDSLGIHVARRLLDEPFVYFQLSAKHEGKWTAPGGLTYQPERPFGGRVVLVIDERTFSTASNFARCLRDLHPNLRIAGRPDGAGTGAPRRIAVLPHSQAEITLCTHRVRGPAGAITEGNPVIPDVVVEWSSADLRAGVDPDLAAALKLVE